MLPHNTWRAIPRQPQYLTCHPWRPQYLTCHLQTAPILDVPSPDGPNTWRAIPWRCLTCRHYPAWRTSPEGRHLTLHDVPHLKAATWPCLTYFTWRPPPDPDWRTSTWRPPPDPAWRTSPAGLHLTLPDVPHLPASTWPCLTYLTCRPPPDPAWRTPSSGFHMMMRDILSPEDADDDALHLWPVWE